MKWCWSVVALHLLIGVTLGAAPTENLKIIVQTKERVVVVQVRTELDGQPRSKARALRWKKHVHHLFQRLDANGDGILDPREAARAPSPVGLSPISDSALAAIPVHVASSFALLDSNSDGKATPQELADYYGTLGESDVQISYKGPSQQEMQTTSRRLWSLLDSDGDGNLSEEELRQASQALPKWDRNEDELLTLDELPVAVSGSIPVHVAAPYLKEGTAALPQPFLILDANDQREGFKRFASLSVDVEVIVRLGARKADQSMMAVVVKTAEAFPPSFFIEIDKANVLQIRNGPALLEMRSRPGQANLNLEDREALLQRFTELDTNRNEALDRREGSTLLKGDFDLFDANLDGQVQIKEFLSYLDETRPIVAAALEAQLALAIAEKGEGLMGFADVNRDGALSMREIQRISPTLIRWDLDNNGLSQEQLPETYQVALGLGQVDFDQSKAQTMQWAPLSYPLLQLNWSQGDLTWFFKMDANRDGDVSLREFLGPLNVFHNLDVDRDGLLSPREAQHATKLRKDR